MSTKEESLCSSRLLLLPPPPSRLTSSSVKELYRQPIERALQLASGTSAYLDIAVHAPYLAPSSSTEFPSRLHNFDKAQELLVILYSHVSDVLRDADRIKHQEQETDVRIIFYYDASENSVIGPHWSFGPVLSLQSLLSSGRNWGSILLTGTSETAVRKLRESISAMGLPELRYATLIYESNFLEDAEDSVTSQGKEDNKSHSLVAGRYSFYW